MATYGENRSKAPIGVATPAGAGWRVTFAGTGVNLALGVLYSWSVISEAIPKEWDWSEADKSLPYSIALLVFAFAMIPAGRMQDKVGPQWVAVAGGVLVSAGMIICSFATRPPGYVVGFGLLAGAGIGFGYAAATPPAVKWFSKARTGLIAGIVVSGFGLASVYVAPAARWLAASYGLPTTMLVFAFALLVAVVGLAQFLKNPPHGFTPKERPPSAKAAGADSDKGPLETTQELGPGRMLRTWQFYLLWLLFAFAAGAGLMVISKMAKIATGQAGVSLGFLLVVTLALGNGGGRIFAGMISDKIGRTHTMLLCFGLQAALISLLSQTVAGGALAMPVVLGVVSALIGANYGANLSLFPAITKDWFGTHNFGVNYGLVFTAWGVGGFAMSLIAGTVYDTTHSFNQAYFLATALLVVAAALTFAVNPPHALAKPKKILRQKPHSIRLG